MVTNLRDQYQAKLHNWLIYVHSAIVLMQRRDSGMSLEEQLKTLDQIDKQIPEARRVLMFLINTRRGN